MVVKCCVGVAGVLGWRAQNSAICEHIYHINPLNHGHTQRFRRILAYVASTAFLQFCFVGARLRKHTDGRPKQIGYSSEGCPILQHNDQGKMSTIEGWSGKSIFHEKNNKTSCRKMELHKSERQQHHTSNYACLKSTSSQRMSAGEGNRNAGAKRAEWVVLPKVKQQMLSDCHASFDSWINIAKHQWTNSCCAISARN